MTASRRAELLRENVPAELQELPRWVVWRWGDVDPKTGKRKKPPYLAARPQQHASSTDSSTWGTFEACISLVETEKADGVGFALEPPYVGLDLDEELPEADRGAIMLKLDSYSEKSVSGTGDHVVIRAALNGRGRHPAGIGIFTRDRLFYFSGDHIVGMPKTIEERQHKFEVVLEQFLPKRQDPAPRARVPLDLDDQALLERARRAENGAKFAALYDRGNVSGYASHSEGDLALCGMLAFWTGRDPERLDRLFRASGLMREKWGRDDYREATIEETIAGCRDTYSKKVTRGPESPVTPSPARESLTGKVEGDSASKESPSPESALPRVPKGDLTPESPRPFALPIRDFICRPRERREPILADADGRAVIGHRSLTLLGALGGHGKTTLFIDLALHLAAGVDWGPFQVPAPVSILMIENEGPEDLFAEKLAARHATFAHELRGRFDVCVFDWGGFNLGEDVHRERLANEIAEKGYELVFGDPLDSLGIIGVGSPEDTRDFLALMKETGLNRNVAWWLNTHPRKEETKEALNEIAGAWGGKPDSVLLLRMLADDRTQVRFPKLRWAKRGKRLPMLLKFDPETEAFTYLGEESEEERDYLAEIGALLDDGKWRTPKEIAAKPGDAGIGANVDRVKKELSEHPDVFMSRTGEEAKAVGRSSTATIWSLRTDGSEPEQESL